MRQHYPDFFETAFTEGFRTEQHNYEYRLVPQEIGQLQVPTGKIVANDPLVMFETEPFTETFPTGSFPVQLAIAQVTPLDAAGATQGEMEPDERVALARIVFADRPVASWKMAVWENSDVTQLAANEFFGYGVDAGTGAFMDEKACKRLESRLEQDEAFSEALMAEMDQTYKHTRSWLVKDMGDGCNIAMFSSGWGDGSYASYIGYDADGQIVRLLTDFYLVDWMEGQEGE
ncbi:hypothetical protein BAG01nite_05760 [Brevibacillus agri]|uniref:DUF4241 domain-containing protein n=2 Tax=Brevibacillus agri TaxID=51101 RepID=A0A3M8BC60_9BACL|nr:MULTISPECIES: DUF4241 domain-containing protein [Brevibacillus]ELK39266.1 hypothetical protein D478_25338 [Brevibacillus agri BAB-2500]EJL39650.1 hypothetical protein PMI08_04759 [Brevibacillus sp. CF112]MBG9564853.1 hypothetical protein [Brevibacillus agri]MBY0050155.1 DUF4241 domain-containing protein [Brevibacillus agri]MDN4092667.1 DUF4241 domain-containing protein [Brevibacillus agri]